MSYIIDGINIAMTRGDTFRARFPLYMDGEEYELQEGDAVRWALKDADGEHALIEKDISGDYMLVLDPEDTKALDYGTYRYDCQITFAENGDTITYIPDTPTGKAKVKLTWEAD